MFNPRSFENSRLDGFSVLEIVNGKPPGTESPRRFVPLKRTELKGQAVGPMACLRLVQTFGYPSRDCDKVLEALYRFPLPGDAAVTAVLVRFGDVAIATELKERERAEKEYEAAKENGRQAVLATRESPDVFTLRIAGLQPDQDIVVETFYVELAKAEGAGWSLRIPLTTAPRYLRSDELTARHAQGEPPALLRDPGHRFSLDLAIQNCGAVESPTHPIDVEKNGSRARIHLKEGEVLPDRDCVLSWRPTQQAERPNLQVFVQDDPSTEHAYFMALVAPPATSDRGRSVPREVILLVDHSGSMQGPKWDAADWAVERFLSELTERDSLALGLFHDTTRWFLKQPRSAGAEFIGKATAFLKNHRDTGGTELGVALEQALNLGRQTGESARHVLVITDAQVTDSGRILRLADSESKRSDRRRVSVLCIDAAPNSLLATELAEQGGGVARFLTSEPDEDDITTSLDQVLADWSEPVLCGLRLEVNRATVEASGRQNQNASRSGWSAVDLGDLPAGRPIWVAGRVPRGDAGNLEFRVTTGKGHEIAAGKPETQPGSDVRPELKALFGARRLRGLEFLIHSGYSGVELNEQLTHLGFDAAKVLGAHSATPPKVYAENIRNEAHEALRELLVRESLAYGLASSETAFIAVRIEAGKPIEKTVAVASAVPGGWSVQPSAFGHAAAAAPMFARRSSSSGGLLKSFQTTFFGATSAASCASAAPAASVRGKSTVVFTGVPTFENEEAVLYDSATAPGAQSLPTTATINRLEVQFPNGAPDLRSLHSGLCLLIYVGDLGMPRARVKLADIVRMRGARPLNLRRTTGDAIRLILVDPDGAWHGAAPAIVVSLEVQP